MDQRATLCVFLHDIVRYVKNSIADIWKIIGLSGVISVCPRKVFFLTQEIYECPQGNHGLDIFETHVAFQTSPLPP